ncbi:MAG: hypothetical protein BAJATHORv1_30234 [Candidatus Thorarchaeota archaeon]|nr:MAG: hypothetical protein BAJATHORv1_30234 [Candidatus Thorarchaeota archaeon]
MTEEDTYLRAKLTEIKGSIDRLTDLLNRMIEVIAKITEVETATSDLALAVAANSEKIDEVLKKISSISIAAPAGTTAGGTLSDKQAVSSLQAVLENLESQIREGVIASDLAVKIGEAADAMEQRGGTGPLILKMNRWGRILKTYGRVDTISPTDLKKLRDDLKEWQKEVAQLR